VISIPGPIAVDATDASLSSGEGFTWNGEAYTHEGIPADDANGVAAFGGGSPFYFSTNGALYSVGQAVDGYTPGPATLVCYLEGTLIATPEGERAVETLAIGDVILTADGRAVPVKWMGRQRIRNGIFASPKMEPVCISAGALGQGLPHSDLYVTAAHGMIWHGMVVNAGAMVNGTTIRFVPMTQMPPVFTWFHIETEGHEEILAQGAPSETFVDYVGRSAFDNYQEYLDLYGAERIIPEMKHPRISAQRMLPNDLRAQIGLPAYGAELEAEAATWRW